MSAASVSTPFPSGSSARRTADSGIPGLRYEVRENGQAARRLRITIPAAPLEERVQAELRRIRRKVHMPGFRRGRAPKARIEARYGKEVLRESAWGLIGSATRHAITELGAKPLAPPDVEGELVLERGEPLHATVAFEVWPDIGEVELDGVEVERVPIPVGEEQILATLERIREERAPYETVSGRGVRDGDLVVGDVEETDPDDPSAPPTHRENAGFHVGREAELRPLNEAFQGKRVGETAVAVGGGKRIAFTVKEVRAPRLPPVNDELARAVGANSLLALRGTIRDRLRKQAKEQEEMRFHDEVVEAVLKRNPVDPPEALVQNDLRAEISKAISTAQAGGMDQKEAEERIRPIVPRIKAKCERRVRMSILLDALAQQEGIGPADGAVAGQIGRLAERTGKSAAAVKATLESDGELEQLRLLETRKAALDFLLERAAAPR